MTRCILCLVLLTAFSTAEGQSEKIKEDVFTDRKDESLIKDSASPLSPESRATAARRRQSPGTEKADRADSAAEDQSDEAAATDDAAAKPEVGYRFFRGEKEVNFEFGISPFRPSHFTGPEEYDTNDRKLGLMTFRWGRVIGTRKTITYQYLFEAIPFVYSYRNEVRNPAYVDPQATPYERPTMRKTSYGMAVTPAAFRFYFFSRSRLKPFAQFGAGFMITNKPMPLPETSCFNFTGYYGGGALYHLTRRTAVTLSYRYYHISNFNTTEFNPGYNANTFAVGYSYFFK